ncbi:hypothetical protein IWW36_002594 [Coemansia brasiliensis]|uniref:Uncharacterized protein n=1 Tax=Coemansia brasiliensis TaxID=2650707 RepID=A0A9W8I7P8_9FUNG|nr:hypothetical protein IWW36_002594 [Coemansia brasiliensis]
MKSFALAASLVAVASAQVQPVAIPSPTLNQAQMEALASLSAAQAELNNANSQLIADNQASQEAAIFSQSAQARESELSELGSLDSSESESESSLGSLEENTDSGASSLTSSLLAAVVAVGAALF